MQRKTATSIVVGLLATGFAVSWFATGRKTSGNFNETLDGGAEVAYLGSQGVIFQDRSNDCGVAALMMVLDHYGIRASQKELERRARLGFRGASLGTMKELAISAGLDAEGWKLSFDDLLSIQFPAIIFIENHHFVVVDSVDEKGFLFLRDPAVGRLRIPRRRAIDIWNGETLVIACGSR